MSESRAIQRRTPNAQVPGATIMTPQGPAMIQVIDLTPPGGGLGSVLPYGGGSGGGGVRRGAGINILSAVLKRWWLVLLVWVVIAVGAYVGAEKFMKPTFEAKATLRYQVSAPSGMTLITDPAATIRAAPALMNGPKIALVAAKNPGLQDAMPWLKFFDLSQPAAQREVILRLRDVVSWDEDKQNNLIYLSAEAGDGNLAAALVNAYAEAVLQYVAETVTRQENVTLANDAKEYDKLLIELSKLNKDKLELALTSNSDAKKSERDAINALMRDINAKKSEAMLKRMGAEASLAKWRQGEASAVQYRMEQQRQLLMDTERAKDALLQAALQQVVTAFNKLQELRAAGMTESHPDVKNAEATYKRAMDVVSAREAAISVAISAKVKAELELKGNVSLEEATQALKEAEGMLEVQQKELAKLTDQLKGLSKTDMQIALLDDEIGMKNERRKELWKEIQDLRRQSITAGATTVITIEEPGYASNEPTVDKRTKVQMAGGFGGLMLGLMLALLVDRFDKRLRHPRDIEPMIGAPVLGMIPRIQELKRIKGDQARNLIAEEFRIIRTQLLFGNPAMQYKTICVSSPQPGDGKTSLAVNLAISIAKAGRRTLLVDGDMRKPDVHRIFNIPDAPGLAELVSGTTDLSSAIRKSDIEQLDVLPAGVPMVRPSELMSRPEMQQLIATLAEMYDHIIFDSAPLLPVSDTHVLVGLVDGVVCSFNAEVDRDTVKLVEEILKRSNANLVGTVMNQVKYKHTNTYHRGKSAYDSYYNSPRGAGAPTPAPGSTLAKRGKAGGDVIERDDSEAA